MTEMAHLVMENEKLRRKVKKAQQRRDHYARLYYRVLAELDETKWEVTMSRNKIRELKSQGEFVCLSVMVYKSSEESSLLHLAVTLFLMCAILLHLA